jgi:hypothetical protein
MAMSVFRTQEGSEIWDSKGNVKQHEIKYFVLSPDNKNAAIKAVLDDSPEIDYGLIRSSVRFDGFDDDGNAEITVIYEKEGLSGSFSSEESTVSFDCGTGTRHVTNAIRQWELWRKPNTSIPSPGTFIGWNGKTGPDMQVTGADVPFAQPRETYTKKMRLSQLTTSFKRRVASIVGCVNNAKWKGWEKGEVMFLGCSFSGTSSEEITVTFNFAIQTNETATIADGVPPIRKEGYIYVWTMSETAKSTPSSGSPDMKVKAVYAAQVAQYADFASLGL